MKVYSKKFLTNHSGEAIFYYHVLMPAGVRIFPVREDFRALWPAKEDIGGAALIQVTYASRKAFRGKAQLFAKGDIGGLIVRNDDTDQSRVSKP